MGAVEKKPSIPVLMNLGAATDSESGTAHVQIEGIVPSILVAAVDHHSSGEALDRLFVFRMGEHRDARGKEHHDAKEGVLHCFLVNSQCSCRCFLKTTYLTL